MSLITKLMKLFGKSDTDIEIYCLKRNIADTEIEIGNIYNKWDKEKAPCCPDCFSAGKYGELQDKNFRRKTQLERLLKRKKK